MKYKASKADKIGKEIENKIKPKLEFDFRDVKTPNPKTVTKTPLEMFVRLPKGIMK